MKQNYLQFLYNSMIRFLPLIETFLSCELMKTFVHLLSSESLDGPLQSKKLPGTHIARSRECDIHWTCFKRYMQKVCRRGSFAQGIQNNLLLSRKATRCLTHKLRDWMWGSKNNITFRVCLCTGSWGAQQTIPNHSIPNLKSQVMEKWGTWLQKVYK